MDDGLGDDDRMEGDDDVDNNDSEDHSPHHPKCQHYNPLQWLILQFNKKLNECCNCNLQGLPSLYCDSQSFWFPIPFPFFILSYSQLAPQDLMIAHFFLWIVMDTGVLWGVLD